MIQIALVSFEGIAEMLNFMSLLGAMLIALRELHLLRLCSRCYGNVNQSSFSLLICSSSLLSARLKAFKMSLDQVELVSKLLRASRNCNELLLKDCFKEILEHGITPKELNSTDKSGRVSDSKLLKMCVRVIARLQPTC